MGVTQKNNSFELTAAADAVARPLFLTSLKWSGTGLTAGQHLIVRDENAGSILADHYVAAANEDVEFLVQERWVRGIYIDTYPAAGTSKVIALTK